ncbi:unnamed protein product [Rhizophagus irregularis]|nr:unnamed protein product [Rhizophagus irregularis]
MYNPVVDVVICDVDATTPLPWNSRGISYRYISYVITADAKIVQVIEGKDKKKGSSSGENLRSHSKWERLRRNDYGKEEYEEDKIDGPLKSSKDNDLERNLSRDEEVVNLVTQLQ